MVAATEIAGHRCAEGGAAEADRNTRRGRPQRPRRSRASATRKRKELAALPEKIDTGERERAALYASLADPAFLRNGAKVAEAKARLAILEKQLEDMALRWEALEALS